MQRSSGILMPMSSLPSKYGIGTMGKAAYEFVDFLHASGQSWWQLLPLGPTGFGDSPYSSVSTFAGNPYYIDLDMLIDEGLLSPDELDGIDWGSDDAHTDYGRIYSGRYKVLASAFSHMTDEHRREMEAFRRESGAWLENYALYMAVKGHFGMACWTDWPDAAIRKHEMQAVRHYTELLKNEIDFQVFMQYLFFRQWNALREYAAEKGVRFIGDIPIYVALDSADVWSEPQFFRLDSENVPVEISGVPPDAFTEDGQLWGNPIYDWDKMRADGYGWWIRRIEGARKLYDVIRIDHFRGFCDYWSCPYGAVTAKEGVWKKGPGMGLVGVLTSWFHDVRFVAEDLGVLTPGLERLLLDSGLPGMKVLQFAFDSNGDSSYLPHNCIKNSVCYIGTHDNDTVLGWVETMSDKDREFASHYMHITADEGWCWGLIRTGMAASSDLFIVQMQDVLELGGDARMNFPGTTQGNWQWRMLPGALTKELAEKLREYTVTYRRTAIPAASEPDAGNE